MAAGHLGAVGGRLAAWTDRAEEALDAAARSRDANRHGLAERGELRGRLAAYRAKAGRVGAGEDERLAAAERTAHDLLWTAPCDLDAAGAAVAAYAAAVASLGAAPAGGPR